MNFSKDYLRWERFLNQFPNSHLLQSGPWGKFKEQFGWDVYHLFDRDWGAQILVRPLLGIFRLAYIPKGPVASQELLQRWIRRGDSGEFSFSVLEQIRAFCREKRIAFVKVEPDVQVFDQNGRKDCPKGFVLSSHTIQPLRTILVEIGCDEQEILARMKQKTRYNIRLAERKGVRVEPSNDIDLFYQMMLVTGKRDRFSVHVRDYYQQVFRIFKDRGECELFLATYQDKPLAGLMAFAHGERAHYFYGASLDNHRELMAPHLLQWRAILWAKQKGCTIYDLWGIPDYDEAFLEQQFEQRRNGLWGVYRFKRGFGGQVVRYAGAYDYVASPLLYAIYRLYTQRTGVQS